MNVQQKTMGILLTLLCAGIMQASSVLRPTGTPATINNLKAYSILIPEKPTEQERFSAKMLVDYLAKIYKIKLPIIQEPKPAKSNIISVGNTASASATGITADPREQAYKLAVTKDNLYILGGTRGPIYGVIALLEEDLGCRWYTAKAQPVIPTQSIDKLTVVPRSYSPPFEVREPLYLDAYNAPWSAFNRLQTVSYFNKIPRATGGGLANTTYFIHTYDLLIPAKKYFATNPEYFPLRNGKRHPSRQTDGQLCYTNPGVINLITKKLDAEIAKNPGKQIYSVSANDNVYDNCECQSCQKIIKVDGIAGAQLYLANEVANKLAVKYPEIKITTLAYVASQKPPKSIKPGPNTVIFYAPIRQRGNHMNLPIGDIKEIANELAAWNKIASNIYLWDYTDIVDGVPVPSPNFDLMDRSWQFLINNGVTGVFLQGAFLGHASLAELKCWLFAKKMWNPHLPQDALIKEFVTYYYGPAADVMAEYIAFQRQVWMNYYTNRKPGESLKFSTADIAKMNNLLNSALKLCVNDTVYHERIERERLPLLSLCLSSNPRPATAADYASNLKQAEALISKLKINKFGGISDKELLSRWRKKLKRVTDGNGLPKYSPNSITVKKPACLVAEYRADKDANLGKASRQAGGKGDWGVQWRYGDFLDLLNQKKQYILRIRVKPEFMTTPTKAGELFRLGYYTFGVGGKQSFAGEFSAGEQRQYHWVELCKIQVVTPSATGYLYSISGKDLTTKDAVWYDYIEFIPEDEFKDTKLANKLPSIKI